MRTMSNTIFPRAPRMRPFARMHLPGTLEAVAKARRWARRCVSAYTEGGPDLADTVELLVSEAVTNAVAHTVSGKKGGTVALKFLPCRYGARIEVHDCGGVNASTPHLRAVAPDSEHGRGLAIIAALAEEWGIIARPSSGIWFTVAHRPGQPAG